MAYEIVKFADDAGNDVSITPADVKQTFCPNASDKEVQLFLALCATKRLNPFIKEAYLVKYGNNPAQMITSRAAFQKRADATPDYEGTEIGVVVLCADGSIQRLPGEAYYPSVGQQLIGGWARVYRKGRKPYYTEVPRQEYDTGKNNWARMPATMIAKVAETHALRMAFPSAFDGMYAPEEMDQAETQEVSAEVSVPAQPAAQALQQPATADPVDEAWVAQQAAYLASVGYVAEEVGAYLSQKWQQGGRQAAEQAAQAMAASAQPQPVEPDEVEV